MLKGLFRTIFFLAIMAVIALSVITKEVIPTIGLPDILLHMAAYAFLAFAGGIAFGGARIMVAGGLLLLGIILELLQALIPGRDANGYEFFADAVGIVIGFLAAILVKNFLNKYWKIWS